MATIVYLDAEDEITSAASRIRMAGDTRVGLVLPFGSRVATSRINFRLLAREAQANGRRLDIVAPDASARALAASAGLPVFSSVGEYEAALDADDDAGDATVGRVGHAGTAAAGLAAGAIGAEAIDAGASGVGATASGMGAAASPAGGSPVQRHIDQSRDTTPVQRASRSSITEPASGDYGAPGIAGAGHRGESRAAPVPRRRSRLGIVVVAIAALLVLAAAGVTAFLFLPTAQITVTPVIEPVGPVSFSVTADPGATAVDPVAGTIPATTLQVPVTADGEFPATGKRVVETRAAGGVRFQNCDPSASYQIPAGTIVRTRGGLGFATAEAVFLPVASISGTPPNIKLTCQTSEVAVTADEGGPDGNVGAGQIRVVPARYNRNLVRVSNPAATTGGKREEFPKVLKKDVDAALAQLMTDAETRFQAELVNPDRIPDRTTAFPETAVLGDVTPTVDPSTLVGQEVEAFTLGVTANGAVQAVDASPVTAIAEERLRAEISDGYELVDGSTRIDVGGGTVLDGVITFEVSGSARQVRPVAAAELERLAMGLSKADAEAALAPYGQVDIVLWPDWVGTVPTQDQRVTLIVADPVDPAGEAPSEPAPTPTAEPASATPVAPVGTADDVPSEPVPSG